MFGDAGGLGDFARRGAAVVLAGEQVRAASSSSRRGSPRGRRIAVAGLAAAWRQVAGARIFTPVDSVLG